MDFDTWCEQYNIDENESGFGMLVMAWQAATNAERERCCQVIRDIDDFGLACRLGLIERIREGKNENTRAT